MDKQIREMLVDQAEGLEVPVDAWSRQRKLLLERQVAHDRQAPARALWARLRPKVELAAACLVLGSLLTFAALGRTALSTTPVKSVGGAPGRLVFLSGGHVEILVDGKVTRVALPEGFSPREVSPNGSAVLGVSRSDAGDSLAALDLTDGQVRQLAPMSNRANPTWSPDGSLLAVSVRVGATSRIEIHGFRSEARSVEISVGQGPVQTITWSPDGEYLAVQTGDGMMHDRDLWLVSRARASAALIEKGSNTARWAPDGKALSYIHSNGDSDSELVTYGLDGKRQVVVDKAMLRASSPELASLLEAQAVSLYGTFVLKGDGRLGAVFKAAGQTPRFVLVTEQPGGKGIATRILPVFPDDPGNKGMYPPLPCHAIEPQWAMGGEQVVTRLGGPGCLGKLVILDSKTLAVIEELRIDSTVRHRVAPNGEGFVLSGGTKPARYYSLGGLIKGIELPMTGELSSWSDLRN